MKVLYLDTGFDSASGYFRRQRELVKGCVNVCLYKNQEKSFVQKVIMALGVYVFPPLLYFVYGDWKKHLEEYDMFIVVSRQSSRYALKYIKKKTNKRVVVWYWNLVTEKELPPEYCKMLGCETWSFDKSDCKKYDMKFGDTYYFPPQVIKNVEKEYDLFYVGINRPGREAFLRHLGEYLKSYNLSPKFNLTAIPTEKKDIRKRYARRLTYEEVMDYISKSSAILDLNRENQSGMTLRPLEALFFGKKLVTNNRDIVNYKAYNPENVFVIKDNNFDGLAEFIQETYSGIDNDLTKNYSFNEWLTRLYNNIEAE